MEKMKHRKRISLFMAFVMIVTTLQSLLPGTAVAADTATGTSGISSVSGAVVSVTGSAASVSGPAVTFDDPITPDMVGSGVSTIDQVYSLSSGTTVTVIGQVSYIYGQKGTADTALIQDVINGDIIGLQIYDKTNISKYHIGDIVEVTGKVGSYGGVCQLTNTTVVEKGVKTAFPAQELTIAQLKAGGDSFLSELVRIKNVTMNTYNATNTVVQDSTDSINIYKAAPYPSGLAVGDTADITAAFSKYNTTYQLRNLSGSDYSKIIAYTEQPVLMPDTETVPFGQEITITTATSGAAIYYSTNGGAITLYNEAVKPVVNSFPYSITAYASKTGLNDSTAAAKTYTQSKTAAVDASANGEVKLGTKLVLTTATTGAAISYSIDDGATWKDYDAAAGISLNKLPISIQAKATAVGYLDSDIITFSYTERVSEYSLYFGQLHSHTNYSDGSGTCEEAFEYAKNSASNIDFLAVTDHSNSFDNASSATILDGSMSTEWVQGHSLADQYTDSTFVGIYGYEMTWSNGLGHINTFNTEGFQTREQSAYTTYSTALANYYSALKQDSDSISQFNHPGTTFGDFDDFSNYDDSIDKLISLIEVGNGEGAVGSSGYFASYEYYTRALDKGWHIAPTNNQDNHKGLWGTANTARTVVLADSLTRSNIYDAMRNMRVYATEDSDLQIQYTLNDNVMGTIMTETPSEVAIKVDLKDPTDSAIGKVDVIVNGGLVAATKTVTDNEESVTFNLPADYSYYYIKVTQSDSDIAVTAPVWIKDVEAAGISKISTTEKLPVKGEKLTIDTELYNNETSALSIQTMDFSIDDTIIHTVDLGSAGLSSLVYGETKTYSFDYTNNTVGAVNVKVTVHAALNGVEKLYTSVLKLEYTDPAMVTKIVVDGTHYNDYVTGYYGDNFGNIAEIAADYDAKVNVVKDAITEETLKDCDLLIISAPAKKSGTANAGAYVLAHFEDDFINLVKNYVANGGDVIICGLADYQDTANGQSSTEINKLLAAINATTRINSDEAYDTVSNGGQAYRLYLDDYNTVSGFLSGVAAGQVYSAYSGCTVLLDNSAVAAGKAEYLVKGHSTTYSIDSKTYGGNYTAIDTGNAVLLSREVLDSGSNVFVSGTVFMSNFEVKATVDNAGDLQYSNRTIMENILESVKRELPVSNISSVRSGVKGNVYCVEGTVTSGTVSGNAFFDTIYVQDATGGINVFPINSGLIEVGQKVKVIGYLDEYLGDLELRVISAAVTDTNKALVNPETLSTKDAMNYSVNGGKLVKITGTVTSVTSKSGQIETIIMKDSSDTEARVFIDGYIGYSDTTAPAIETFVSKDKKISVIGLVSYDTEGVRLRVRNRNEITEIITPDPTVTPTLTEKPTATPTVTPIITPTIAPTPTVKPTSTPVIQPSISATVTPTPSPTATPTQIIKEVEVAQGDSGIKATMSATLQGQTIDAQIEINADELLKRAETEGTPDKPLPVSLQLSSADLNEQLGNEEIQRAVIEVTVPNAILNNDNVEVNQIIMDSEMLRAAAQEKKDISVIVKDETGRNRYSWSFDGDELSGNSNALEDVNVAMSVESVSAYQDQLPNHMNGTGLVLNFEHEGVLPAPARVRIYVGDLISQDSSNTFELNDSVFVYYVNSETGKLESLPFSSGYKLDEYGYITINLVHCSNYVILPKPADSSLLTPLKDQITITVNRTALSTKGKNKTAQIQVNLPSTLELVASLEDKTSNKAIGAVTVSYASGNEKVAKVDDKGKITAVGKGKTTITVTFDLYNGKTKTYKVKITVK